MVDIDVCLPRTLPQRQFIRTFPDNHLWASFWYFRLSCFTFSQAPVQASALTVNLYEFSQTFRETFSALLTEDCHDVLCEAVSIFLLVCQQFQRIDRICAQALRCCMRFEDLGLIDTFTCLYDLEPVWLLRAVLSLHTSRTTNYYVLSSQRPTKCSLPMRNCCNAGTSMTS